MLTRLRDHLKERYISLYWNDAVLEYIAKSSYSEKFGARNMRRFIERHVDDKIANIIIDGADSKISGISLDVKDGEITISSI